MRIEYMRESTAGPSLAEQQALLRLAGIEDFSRNAPAYTGRRRKVLTARHQSATTWCASCDRVMW
jgi:hypothetical protein